MSEILEEFWKILPVTRTLLATTLAVTLPVILEIVWAGKLVFTAESITHDWELWRLFTTFHLGSGGIWYIFELWILYQTTVELESRYTGRNGSANLAWQIIVTATSLLIFNLPLETPIHTRPLLVALTYVASKLAPPGTQISFFGLFTLRIIYQPYVLVLIDLLIGGPRAAAIAFTGIVAGHLWWWSVFHAQVLEKFGQAPEWVRAFFEDPNPRIPGVRTIAPTFRRRQQSLPQRRTWNVWGFGHSWGKGQKLGG